MKTYVMFGAAGFVAPRHMEAIAKTGGNLVAAVDPSDSVGVLDSYFPECRYFRELERFERFCDHYMEQTGPIDYVVVCSPNYLHDAHCAFGLRMGANVICEKPVTVRMRNLWRIRDLQSETGRSVHVMYQLRCSEQVKDLLHKYQGDGRFHKVEVDYGVKRGHWYEASWKGQIEKSGWIPANIGTHIFDLLTVLFGNVNTITLNPMESYAGIASGTLLFDRAHVKFNLWASAYKPSERIIRIDGEQFVLGEGKGTLAAAGLHTAMYEEILAGRGVGLEEAEIPTLIADQLLTQYQGRKVVIFGDTSN